MSRDMSGVLSFVSLEMISEKWSPAKGENF